MSRDPWARQLRLTELIQQLLINCQGCGVEADEAYLYDTALIYAAKDSSDGDSRGTMQRESIGARADRWKGDRASTAFLRELHAALIAGSEQFVFAIRAAAPYGTNRVKDPLCWKPESGCRLGGAGLAAIKLSARREQFGAGCLMDCAVNPAAAEQRCVRSVYDDINRDLCDVALKGDESRHMQARSSRSARTEA